jgi:hypothetical protein
MTHQPRESDGTWGRHVCSWCNASLPRCAEDWGPTTLTNYGICALCLEREMGALGLHGQHPHQPPMETLVT